MEFFWHEWTSQSKSGHMVEMMHRDFNEYHITQVPPTENQLGEMQMMEEVAEHVGMN